MYLRPDTQEEMDVKVVRWGNGLAVGLPIAVVEALGLEAGDQIEIRVLDDSAVAIARACERDELLERLRVFRGRLPSDFVFDRELANAR